MRDLIIDNGYNSSRALITKKDDFVSKMCSYIRKSSGSAAGRPDRNVTVETEQRLSKLQLFTKCCYMTEREVDLNNGPTLEVLDSIGTWFDLQPEDPKDDPVKNFKEGANMKIWFQSVKHHLGTVKGASGFPLLYTIREERELEDDETTHETDFDEDIAFRGRLAGHFWAADNRILFQLLQIKTHGTIAWNEISECKQRMNGRLAYMKLRSRFMGEDVQHSLCTKAEAALDKIRFDGSSKQFTYSTYISAMREAWEDLGPWDVYSDERKVQKLLSSFQVKALSHAGSTINASPHLRTSFDSSVSFIASELANLKMKTGAPTRSLAAMETQSDDKKESATREELQRKLKSMRADLKKLGRASTRLNRNSAGPRRGGALVVEEAARATSLIPRILLSS